MTTETLVDKTSLRNAIFRLVVRNGCMDAWDMSNYVETGLNGDSHVYAIVDACYKMREEGLLRHDRDALQLYRAWYETMQRDGYSRKEARILAKAAITWRTAA